jgi:hypothetical protein
MTTFIFINNEVFPTDTIEEIKEAQAEMLGNGIGTAEVWVGDPEGDHHKNGQRLFAQAENGLSR